jgi:dihydrofolate reductase
MMRKVTYGGANSADNFITGPDEDVGWLRQSDEVQQLIKASWKGVDTMLMGRKTWEFAVKMGMGAAMKGVTTYVFSSTLENVPDGVELVRSDAVEFVRDLKSGDGGDIIVMGGGELGTALIEGGLVDEIGLNIHPVLLGRGTPLFRAMSRRVELQLIEARPMAEGCVLVRYRVVND